MPRTTFNPNELDRLRLEFGKLRRIDPDSPIYTKLWAKIENMNPDMLKQVADAAIPFLSSMAQLHTINLRTKRDT